MHFQDCQTSYEQQCSIVNEEECQTVTEQECTTVDEEACNTVFEEKCQTVDDQECSTVQVPVREKIYLLPICLCIELLCYLYLGGNYLVTSLFSFGLLDNST